MTEPREITLKCHPEPFAAIRAGTKTHEFRINDRDYKLGDVLVLREYDPEPFQGVWREGIERRLVTHISYGPKWGIPDGYCVMSIARLPSPTTVPGEARGVRGYWKGVACLYERADECPDIDCSHNVPSDGKWIDRVIKAARTINTERLLQRGDLTAIPWEMFEELRDVFVQEPIGGIARRPVPGERTGGEERAAVVRELDRLAEVQRSEWSGRHEASIAALALRFGARAIERGDHIPATPAPADVPGGTTR